MGANSSVAGLILQIDGDPANANAAVEDWARKTGQSVGYVQAQVRDYNSSMDSAYAEAVQRSRNMGEETDRALLSNRESVRLLSEEMGVHLPRAVSGALAEMLPGIHAIGPALLGAFALAEIPKFIDAVKGAAQAFGGYTEAVQKAEKADVEASNQALIHFKTIADGTRLIAETNAALVRLAATQGTWTEVLKQAGEGAAKARKGWLDLLGPIGSAVNLYREYQAAMGQAGKEDSQTAELRQRLIAQLQRLNELGEQTNKIHKEHIERTRDMSREDAAFYERIAREGEESLKRLQRWHEEWLKSLGMPEEAKFSLQEVTREIDTQGRAAAAALPAFSALGQAHIELTAAQRAALPTDQEIKKVYEDLLKLRPNLTEAEAKATAQQLAEIPVIASVTRETGNEKTIRDQLTAAILKQLVAEGKLTEEHAKQIAAANGVDLANRNLVVGYKQLKDLQDAFSKGAKEGVQALESDTEALQGIAGQIGQLIGSRKAQAEIEGAFDAAKSIEEMAIFIASGGTDGSALLASVQYGLASAEYFKVAGRGGGGSAGAAGGGGGSVGMQGGRAGPQAAGAMGTEVPITPGLTSVGSGGGSGGTNITVHVYGPGQEASHIASVLNSYTTRQGGTLVASRSIAPSKAGR